MKSIMPWFETEAMEAFILGKAKPGKCEFCSREVEHIFSTPSRTYYTSDDRDFQLCCECSQAYQEIIEEQWQEYYSGVL
jgi:hypothetical protein